MQRLVPAWTSLTVSCVSRAILIMSDFTSAVWDAMCLIPGPSKRLRDSFQILQPCDFLGFCPWEPEHEEQLSHYPPWLFLLAAGTGTSSIICHNAAIPTAASRNYLALSPSLQKLCDICCSGRFKSRPVVRDAGSVLDQWDSWSPRRRLDQPAWQEHQHSLCWGFGARLAAYTASVIAPKKVKKWERPQPPLGFHHVSYSDILLSFLFQSAGFDLPGPCQQWQWGHSPRLHNSQESKTVVKPILTIKTVAPKAECMIHS